MKTDYMIISVQANEVRLTYNLLAAGFTWIILAGFIFFPGTFTSLKNSDSLGESEGGKIVQLAVQKIPLLLFACLLRLAGTAGSCCLWTRSDCHQNYFCL